MTRRSDKPFRLVTERWHQSVLRAQPRRQVSRHLLAIMTDQEAQDYRTFRRFRAPPIVALGRIGRRDLIPTAIALARKVQASKEAT